jgi:hypothetical protein
VQLFGTPGYAPDGIQVFSAGTSGLLQQISIHLENFPYTFEPRPSQRADPPVDLAGLWGSSPSNLYAVGEFGTVLHYDGASWNKMNGIPTVQQLNAVWGSGNDVFVVGDCGTVLHWDGNAWSVIESGTTHHLFGVWGFGPNDVYAVGDYGTVLHYDGSAWHALTTGGNLLREVWGAGHRVWFGGESGTILRLDLAGYNVSPADLNFGDVLVSASSQQRDVTISSTGAAALEITSIATTAEFVQFNDCPSSLPPQSSCTVHVRFVPRHMGNCQGTILIADNAPGSPHSIALSGTGTDLIITITRPPRPLRAGAIVPGEAALVDFVLTGTPGVTGNVLLTCEGTRVAPPCWVEPSFVTLGGSSTPVSVRIATSSATPGGTYHYTISARVGKQRREAPFDVVVAAASLAGTGTSLPQPELGFSPVAEPHYDTTAAKTKLATGDMGAPLRMGVSALPPAAELPAAGAAPTSIELSSSPNPSAEGIGVTFTAIVRSSAGVPSGVVIFREGERTLDTATLDSSGIAKYSTRGLDLKNHRITAIYQGSAGFATSSAPELAQQIAK